MNTDKSGNSSITIEDRSTLNICGVVDILSFDDNSVYLKTVLGNLSIDGSELHIQSLSIESGAIFLTGKIDGLYYVAGENKKKSGLFRKS